jgi:WD40 repeat protein
LTIWDLATQRAVLSLEGFTASVWFVAFSPDNKQLAAAIGSYNASDRNPGEVWVWDAATGETVQVLRGHPCCVWSVAFSPDGKRLTSAGGRLGGKEPGEVKIWDMRTGQEVCTLRGHTSPVYSAAFSPCGRYLATSGEDGFVKIWDGTPLAETPAREDPADAP